MKYFKYGITYLLLCLYVSVLAQTTRFVTPQGSGTLSGRSWKDASSSLQSMINASVSGDCVFVARGAYIGNFTLKSGVSIYGGFVGNEIHLSERRLSAMGEQHSLLDGAGAGRVITQNDNFNQTTVVDGFVIEGGLALSGAGVVIRGGTILRRCIIRHNIAGAIAVGDYLPSQGGILYRVDRTAGMGYVMALTNHGTTYPSGRGTLVAKSTLAEAQADLSTMDNHKRMTNSRAAMAVAEFRAAEPASTLSDWMLPSAGDWALFVTGGTFPGQRSELANIVDQKLLQLYQTPLGNGKYWSSTAANSSRYPHMWYANLATSSLNTMSAYQYNRIRPVRAFSLSVGSGNGGGVFASGNARIEGCLIVGNKATEGSGVFAEGAVQIHYSSIVDNLQNGESTVNAEGLVMRTSANSMDYPSLINSVVSGNKSSSGAAANFVPSGVMMSFTALESSTVVAGLGNLSLSSDPHSEQFSAFSDPSGGDYRPLSASPLALAADTRRLPMGLDSDLAGVLRAKGMPTSIGALEATVSSGVADTPLGASVQVYPSRLRVGEVLTVRSTDGVGLVKVTITDLFGCEIATRIPEGVACDFTLPRPGVYLVKVNSVGGKNGVCKVIVN